MSTKIPRSLIIIAVITGSLTILLILFVVFSLFNPSPQEKGTASPTPIPTSSEVKRLFESPSENYTKSVQDAEDKNADFFTHEKKVGELISVLPYQGTNVLLSYDFSTSVFTAVISATNKTQGDAELTTWLQQHGVERSWIRNLVLTYK
jgi:hypothetical protein